MVYPATWKTLPVTIFALTDRGQAFQAAACTTILLLVTLAGVSLADHHRKVLWRAALVSLSMLTVGVLLGQIPL